MAFRSATHHPRYMQPTHRLIVAPSASALCNAQSRPQGKSSKTSPRRFEPGDYKRPSLAYPVAKIQNYAQFCTIIPKMRNEPGPIFGQFAAGRDWACG
jgi:hypothetical protein